MHRNRLLLHANITLRTPKTKAEADAVCAAMGAQVAAQETKKENDVIAKLVYESGICMPNLYIFYVNIKTSEYLTMKRCVTTIKGK